MKRTEFLILCCFVLLASGLHSQTVDLKKENLKAVNSFVSLEKLDGEKVIRVTKDPIIKEFDEPTFVCIKNLDFTNGTIEVKVLSRLLPDAPDFSWGFIGIAFHINNSYSKFESIYIRPTNGRSDSQVRRNHSIQYIAYPDYKFQRLRKDSPEMYESYADMGLNEWIQIRIEVQGLNAKLYINNNKQPSLIVNDLMLGDNVQGAIGLFVDVGTEGFF
jgi:hypothetical protein